jgi:hypothetical protein
MNVTMFVTAMITESFFGYHTVKYIDELTDLHAYSNGHQLPVVTYLAQASPPYRGLQTNRLICIQSCI